MGSSTGSGLLRRSTALVDLNTLYDAVTGRNPQRALIQRDLPRHGARLARLRGRRPLHSRRRPRRGLPVGVPYSVNPSCRHGVFISVDLPV